MTTAQKTLIGILSLIFVALLAGGAYWFLFVRGGTVATTPGSSSQQGAPGFSPFDRGSTRPGQTGSSTASQQPGTTPQQSADGNPPALRLLSATPIGGYGATTTASTTIVRWVDRGRGNIFEARGDSLAIKTLSNTLLPRIYQSVWNKDATAFIGTLFNEDETSTSIYAELKSLASTTSTSSRAVASGETPFALRGKNLPANIVSYAISPKKDRVFMFAIQNGRGIGYISPFAGGVVTQIFDTPITQVTFEWPEENTIALVTKNSSTQPGYFYTINPKTGVWKKVLGPILGLSVRVSHDAKYAVISASGGGQGILTGIYSLATSSSMDTAVLTLADKCVWGNFYKNLVYCAAPSQFPNGSYPDDWYKGTMSFSDKIWQINAITGEVKLISSIVDQSKQVIDAFNLGLDAKDSYLYFMNKTNLSFWSLDLVASH